MPAKAKKFISIVLGLLFCLNILAWLAVYDLSRSKLLEVNFFDVGQGDAIFIVSPQRHQILIDGGPDSTILEKLAKEMPFWDRTIDLIILTHPEHDHLAGLLEVLKRYKVDFILWTGVTRDTIKYQEWQKAIKEERAQIFLAKAGQRISLSISNLDQYPYMDILHPFENLEGKEFKNSNNTSIISRLIFNKNSFLFTGDAYKSVERELIIRENSCSNSCKFASLDADVLKVGHHGSKTSSSEKFLKEVSPEIAVISVAGKNVEGPDCGNKKRNRYGHPSCEVLQRLENFAIKILRTDKEGDIKIISDGNLICHTQKRKKLLF